MDSPAPELQHVILRLQADGTVQLSVDGHLWLLNLPSLDEALDRAFHLTALRPSRLLVYSTSGQLIVRS